MKFRNNWRIKHKQWDKLSIRVRVGKLDILTVEVDKSKSFYMLTVCNFTIKNR
jgi:hypothetical protein